MTTTNEHTTLICLFHSSDQADAAIQELVQLGIPKDSIGVMGSSGTAAANPAAMEKWRVPERDAQTLMDGINKGGTVVAVSAGAGVADRVEDIFGRHQATKIDETASASTRTPIAAKSSASAAGGTINVVEEEMTVGKREVQSGGVRIYKRIVEKPVSENVTLREEHASVERRRVDRPVTDADAAFKDQAVEITESREEAVVSKKARVVEEVVVGKESLVRNETVKGRVRKTEVTVENLEPETKNDRVARK